MTKLRKFFASSVMVMTVVVMSGLTAPMTTNAAASAGDLIKKDGLSAVYYLGEDGKRYVFPNEATYKSWYSDFSGVVTISADELASYPLGGNVVVRPGTKLVKITTDPKVYAVEANGTLRQIPNEAAAIALYGADWAKRVIDVADSFFTNYTIGSPLASNEVPMGSLVKKTGDSNIYYYDGTNYRLIEDEVAFLANRFQYANVLTLSTFTAGGSTITGAEAGIIKTSQNVSTVVNPGQGTGLTVSLNSTTPASQSVPSTVGRIPFTKVNLTASADGAAYIDAITVKETGLTSNATGMKVWAEKNGVKVASQRTLSSNNDVILSFSPVLVVPAGQTVTIDILAEVTAVTGNGALGITSASAISASGSTVSGSFPITGNLMSFTDYTVTKLNLNTTATTPSVEVGDEDVTLGSFDIDFNTNPRDVILNSVVLKNTTGSEDLSKTLMNLHLENSSGNTVSANATFNGRYATFTFNDGGLTMLKDDGDQTFTIKGDVIAKENSSATIDFKLNKKEDLYAYEKSTGFGVSYAHADAVNISTVTITSGAVDLSKKSTSPTSQDVIKGSKSVVALIANVRADEAITAEGLKVYYNGDVDSFQNAKVYVNNALIGSFDLESGETYTSGSFYKYNELIDSSVLLNKGNNEVKVTVDVKSTASSTPADIFQVAVKGDFLTNAEYVSNGLNVASINGTATGETITVSGGGMTFVRNDGYANNKKIVQGATNVSLGKFAIKATDDAIKLTSIVIGENIGQTDGVNTSTPDSSIYDMKLFIDGTQVGSTKDFTSAGATFSSLNYSVAKDTTKNIELFGSFDSSAADVASTTFKATTTVNAQDSLGKTITAQSAVTTQFRVTIGGALSVAKAADTVGANILIAKATEQEVAKFKFTAVDDSANITEFSVINTSTDAVADYRISSYKLYLGSTLLDEATPFSGVTTFNISGNKLLVAANGSQTVTIKAIFNGIENKDDSGKGVKLQIKENSITAKASSGTELAQSVITDDAVVANEMIVRKTKPTFAKVNGFVGGASASQEVLRFTIAADANEDLKVTTLIFSEYGSATSSVSSYTLYEVGDSSAISRTGGETGNSFTGMNIQIAKGTSKTFRLVANTGSLVTDNTFGVTLENSPVGNIGWGEYFIDGYTTAEGASLSEFPIDGGIKTY